MKVRFFYRDGSNYKCNWETEIESGLMEEFIKQNGGLDNILDKDMGSDPLFEIYEFGLDMLDIPLVREYGNGEDDHPFVSILEVGSENE